MQWKLSTYSVISKEPLILASNTVPTKHLQSLPTATHPLMTISIHHDLHLVPCSCTMAVRFHTLPRNSPSSPFPLWNLNPWHYAKQPVKRYFFSNLLKISTSSISPPTIEFLFTQREKKSLKFSRTLKQR